MKYDEFKFQLQQFACQIETLIDNAAESTEVEASCVKEAEDHAKTAVSIMVESILDEFGMVLDD